MITKTDLVKVGKFQKTHALKGELNAILDIDDEFFEEGNPAIIEIDGIYVPFYISSMRTKGSTSFLVQLDGILTEPYAKPFVNKIIYALKKDLAPFYKMEEEEIHDDDLIGYCVFDTNSGNEIGCISEIDSSTDNLLFIIEKEDGEKVFIPAVDDFIESIDDKRKLIMMNLPEGLIDLNSRNAKE